jgi:phosphate transport system protein
MSLHLMKEIEKLKKNVLELSAMVEENVQVSVKSVELRDTGLAQKIMDSDLDIDRKEVEVEEECLKILALYQPVAIDLRIIIAFLKINNDLERIGDLAVNIAERTFSLVNCEKANLTFDFSLMAQKSTRMLKKSLDSLVNMDADMAGEVGAADDEVDAMYRKCVSDVIEAIGKFPTQTQLFLQYLSIARHLERIADHAANIAEDVIYMIEGKIIRHSWAEKKKSDLRQIKKNNLP